MTLVSYSMSFAALHKLLSSILQGSNNNNNNNNNKEEERPGPPPKTSLKRLKSMPNPYSSFISIPVSDAERWYLGPLAAGRSMDSWELARQYAGKSSQSFSRKEKRPSLGRDSKRSVSDSTIGRSGRPWLPRHHRSSSSTEVFDYLVVPERRTQRQFTPAEEQSFDSESSGDSGGHMGVSDEAFRNGSFIKSRKMFSVSVAANVGTKPAVSSVESDSSSTVTQSTYERGHGSPTKPSGSPKRSSHPDVLSFLEGNSPTVTEESIQESLHAANDQSPRSLISSSSPSGHSVSSAISNRDTEMGISPEQSPQHNKSDQVSARIAGQVEATQKKQRKYGTPDMPRGNAKLPVVPPGALTPRAAGLSPVHIVKHLPRAEKLPLTGYELLASRLTDHDRPGPHVRPMYRRFENLNHRLLLHLQDELCELEEQLHRLDNADTQNRRHQNGILPASRRAEQLSGGELQWHKTDILGKIGFKIEQYNHVLSSFTATQAFPTPTLQDIHEYRGYLSTNGPIAEVETRFLDATDDLVCLGDKVYHDDDFPNSTSPTLQQPPRFHTVASQAVTPTSDNMTVDFEPEDENKLVIPLSLAMAAAVILPIMAFSVISGYLERMTVVLLVSMGTLGTLFQARVVSLNASRDFVITAGAYGAFMAVLSGLW